MVGPDQSRHDDHGASTWFVAPVPRIALTQQEACAALGCSEEFFVEHVRPNLRVVRRGRKRLFPVDELRRAVEAMAEDVL
jgi:excisionase family DNA binding protein